MIWCELFRTQFISCISDSWTEAKPKSKKKKARRADWWNLSIEINIIFYKYKWPIFGHNLGPCQDIFCDKHYIDIIIYSKWKHHLLLRWLECICQNVARTIWAIIGWRSCVHSFWKEYKFCVLKDTKDLFLIVIWKHLMECIC